MNRGKKIVVLSHCILNSNSKVEGLSLYPAAMKELVTFFIDRGIGMIQLPCPEMEVYGIKRWGHVKEQFDTLHFRRVCREILKSTTGQIYDYVKNGYEVLGLVGIDGSPSCGVNKTCSSNSWGGETSDKDEFWSKVEDVKCVDGRGVFIEEFIELLSKYSISLKAFSVDESDFEQSVKNLIERFEIEI